MTVQTINPETISAPLGTYSHAILTTGPGQTLNISGQIGICADGRVATGFVEQADAAWKNIVKILGAAGMDASNLTKVVTYLIEPADAAKLAQIRSKYLVGKNRPASTMVVVKSLLKPDWLIEIEATAFKA